jgi:hypothetical protein
VALGADIFRVQLWLSARATCLPGDRQARYEVVADEARVARPVFDWVGRERLSIGEVCRRLTQAVEFTRTGRTVWDRSVLWSMMKNPTYMSQAAFGKTQQGPLRPSTRQHRPRAYAYYRCLGTDAYRFGGERICPNTQVRTDRLELAVWHEVGALLAQPERLGQEVQRRQQASGENQRQERSALEAQVGKLRQGFFHLIDSYTEFGAKPSYDTVLGEV